MPRLIFALTVLFTLLHADDSPATFCKKWSDTKKEGVLSRKPVGEASGMAASTLFPNRIYWINDSGNKDYLHYSSISGQDLKSIRVEDTKFHDTEALTVAECEDGPCVIVADAGNNLKRERKPVLYLFKEKDLKTDTARPSRRVEFSYPDGPHDVEAMAALPNGDLLFIEKVLSLSDAFEPEVFLLTKEDWQNGDAVPTARLLGRLPVRKWLPDKGFLGTAVTDAAMNKARSVLGILTYSSLIEIPLEVLKNLNGERSWEPDKDFSVVPIKPLLQQESLTYDMGGARAVWSTEFLLPEAPIHSITCERIDF